MRLFDFIRRNCQNLSWRWTSFVDRAVSFLDGVKIRPVCLQQMYTAQSFVHARTSSQPYVVSGDRRAVCLRQLPIFQCPILLSVPTQMKRVHIKYHSKRIIVVVSISIICRCGDDHACSRHCCLLCCGVGRKPPSSLEDTPPYSGHTATHKHHDSAWTRAWECGVNNACTNPPFGCNTK